MALWVVARGRSKGCVTMRTCRNLRRGGRRAAALIAALGLGLTTAAACVVVAPRSAAAAGQDNLKPEQWKKMYDDTLAELRAAQDRKNELAKQNERLGAEVERLKKELAGTQGEMASLRAQAAEQAERTFFLRSQYALWRKFLSLYPTVELRWRLFVGPVDWYGTPPDDFDPASATSDTEVQWLLSDAGRRI
jgi:hypothetical protein